MRRQLDACYVRSTKQSAEFAGEQRIAIVDHIAHAFEEPVDRVGEIARDLPHPCAVRLAHDASDVNAARLDVDDEQDMVADETCQSEDLDGEEIHGSDRTQMSLDEGLPRHPLGPLRRRLQAVLVEDALDGVPINGVAEIAERVTQPRVAPTGVLGGELEHELLDRLCRARPTRSAFGGAIVFGSDELAVPAQDGVRRQQAGDVSQHSSRKHPAASREATPLVVGELQPAALKLLAKDPVLFLEGNRSRRAAGG
jgi:hypothetical protein